VRKLLTALACGTLLFADMTIILTPADARGLSRERMRRNARVTTHARVDGQYVYRNGHWGYWHNGVWVACTRVRLWCRLRIRIPTLAEHRQFLLAQPLPSMRVLNGHTHNLVAIPEWPQAYIVAACEARQHGLAPLRERCASLAPVCGSNPVLIGY